jgi:YVTN family beta-propeller protein
VPPFHNELRALLVKSATEAAPWKLPMEGNPVAQPLPRRMTAPNSGGGATGPRLRLHARLAGWATLLLLLPGPSWAVQYAYIANHGGSNVSVIDTASNTVIGTVPVGIHPYGVAVNPAGTLAYVTNEGSNTVSVINTRTNIVVATIPVGVTPEGVAVNPAGTLVYVANWNGPGVSVIDATTNTVVATVTLPNCPAGVAVNPAGTTVYATRECVVPPATNSGAVSVIDIATNTETATIRNLTPEGVAVTPDGTRVYVADSFTDRVSVIDTASNTVTVPILVGSRPEGLAITPDGTRVYVANRGLTSALGTVSVIDTASDTVTATIPVGVHPVGVAITPDGSHVYVVNEGNNNVMVIDTATNAVVGLPIVVGSGPRSYGKFIATLPPPTKLAVTSVNGGASPTVGVGFNVAVQAQDGTSAPANVAANTGVSLSLHTGSGTLGGMLSCTITAGANTCTVAGVTYSVVEGGVSLTATRTSGDALTAGNSVSFSVVALAPPGLVSAASRKVHGSAGTFDLPLAATPLNPTTEPRQGPAQTCVFTFDKPITAATVTIAEGAATAGAPTFSGNDVVVSLTGVTNQQYVTVALTDVASADGGTGGSGSVRVGFLVGDVNQSRVISVADLGLVNAQLSQVVTAANFLKDVNANGTLTVADKGITNANLTKALPAP